MTTYHSTVDSPIGPLLLTSENGSVTGLHMRPANGGWAIDASWEQDDARFADVRKQLDDYFAGRRTSFDLPLHMRGTPFQKQVWRQLQKIPYGETISYAELARRVGKPGAARAVGSANGANPVAVIVPCHRVIAADGTLGGYGGGLSRKEKLLALEGVESIRKAPVSPTR